MKKIGLIAITLSLIPLLFGTPVGAKKEVNFFLARYDGLRPEYYQDLNRAFSEANPDIDLKIIPVDWEVLHDKLVTAIAGGKPPDLSVIATRWLLEYLDMGIVEPIEKYLTKDLIANIEPAAMEARIKNVLYALPVAVGPRFLYYRSDIFKKHGIAGPPDTFEEMLSQAQKIHNPPDLYAVGMTGKKFHALTEYTYYIYENGGDFFEINPDGSYGKCRINDEAGVGALSFMNDLVNKYKVTQPGVTGYSQDEVQDLWASGKLGFILIGAYTDVVTRQRGATFEWDYALMPHFAGKDRHTLLITDSIMMFKSSKNKEAAAKFLEFFYQDEWRLGFDKQVGFPPVLKSVGKMPYFQAPIYRAMVNSMPGAKGWPLVAEWEECNDIIWNAIGATFLGQKTPQEALDEAAAEIDEIRRGE